MKLKDLLENIFSERKNDETLGLHLTGPDMLSDYIEDIKNTDEFIDCEELVVMKFPVTIVEDGKKIENKTFKVADGQKFKGKCYLWSVSLTPEMFDYKKIYEPVLDGSSITPTLYDPLTFKPKKKIVMEFNPELSYEDAFGVYANPSMIEDFHQEKEKDLRKELHDLLDRILDNPEDYQIKGDKGLIVRGFFEEVQTGKDIEKTDLLGIENENPTHALVYFLEEDKKHSKDGEINLKLSSMSIPIELKDKYLEELGPKSIQVTREEIEEFVKRHQ
jgi:hypothetical protein